MKVISEEGGVTGAEDCEVGTNSDTAKKVTEIKECIYMQISP